DRLGPAWHQPRHILAEDGLAEDDAAENVADRSVGRALHLLQAEFLHPRLVGVDGGAFAADADLLHRLCRLDGDAVARLVALLHAGVVTEELNVEGGMDQPLLDEMPDDAGPLVAVHLDARI